MKLMRTDVSGVVKQAGGGFSLLEMLAVMAVITIMMAMLTPAIRSFSDTAGRRGAVNIVMNTLEQARVSALESGREVYVLFGRRSLPDEDGLMVLRETETGSGSYEQMTRWIKLPRGVLLFEPLSGKSVMKCGTGSLDSSRIAIKLPNMPASKPLSAICFTGSGQVAFPSASADLLIHISEGVRDGSGAEVRVTAKEASSLPFEIISLSKYTGRAQLDVTELAAN